MRIHKQSEKVQHHLKGIIKINFLLIINKILSEQIKSPSFQEISKIQGIIQNLLQDKIRALGKGKAQVPQSEIINQTIMKNILQEQMKVTRSREIINHLHNQEIIQRILKLSEEDHLLQKETLKIIHKIKVKNIFKE